MWVVVFVTHAFSFFEGHVVSSNELKDGKIWKKISS